MDELEGASGAVIGRISKPLILRWSDSRWRRGRVDYWSFLIDWK